MRTLTRRSFLSVAATLPLSPEAPEPYPYLREIMDHLEREPIREVTLYKVRSVGPTTAVLENVWGYLLEQQRVEAVVRKSSSLPYTTSILDEAIQFMVVKPRARNVAEVVYGTDDPSDPRAFATMTEGDAARESQWTTSSSSNPIEDIRAFWEAYNTPEAEAARRRARWEELCHLARLLERAGHGDLVPPPYRSGT